MVRYSALLLCAACSVSRCRMLARAAPLLCALLCALAQLSASASLASLALPSLFPSSSAQSSLTSSSSSSSSSSPSAAALLPHHQHYRPAVESHPMVTLDEYAALGYMPAHSPSRVSASSSSAAAAGRVLSGGGDDLILLQGKSSIRVRRPTAEEQMPPWRRVAQAQAHAAADAAAAAAGQAGEVVDVDWADGALSADAAADAVLLETSSAVSASSSAAVSKCIENLESLLRADKALVYWLKNGCMHMDSEGPEIVRPCPALNICSWVPNLFAEPPSLVRDGVESLCPKDNKFLPTIPQEFRNLLANSDAAASGGGAGGGAGGGGDAGAGAPPSY